VLRGFHKPMCTPVRGNRRRSPVAPAPLHDAAPDIPLLHRCGAHPSGATHPFDVEGA
jgi:hypothetical protein